MISSGLTHACKGTGLAASENTASRTVSRLATIRSCTNRTSVCQYPLSPCGSIPNQISAPGIRHTPARRPPPPGSCPSSHVTTANCCPAVFNT